jgi:hypothetical protein
MRRIMVCGLAVALGAALWILPASASVRSATSNGEANKSAATILADARAATAASTSLHIQGTIIKKAQRMSLNISSGNGSGGGIISTGPATINVIVVAPDVYLNADAASWNTLAKSTSAGQLLAGKWIQTTTTDENFGSFSKLLDPETLVQQITSTGKITKGPVTTFRGQPAIPLRDGAHNGTLYVAATGQPYILGLVGSGSSKGSTVIFSQYGTASIPSAPANPVSLTSLQQGAAIGQ